MYLKFNTFVKIKSMKKEQWKPIIKFEGLYEISSLGRIRSVSRKNSLVDRIMKISYDNYGYAKTNLCKDGKMKFVRVHRLVAVAFVPNPTGRPHVNHIDGDKGNPVASNLEWVTRSENHKHAFLNGFQTVPTTKLTKELVMGIVKSTKGPTELAKIYGVTNRTICQIRCGDTWNHITNIRKQK
jgi:hypothetical protein